MSDAAPPATTSAAAALPSGPVVLATLGTDTGSATTVVPAEPAADRWDPPWEQYLVGVALVLAILAFVWWTFLVVRVQDLFRDETAARRRR